MKELSFSTKTKVRHVTIEDEKGDKVQYELREMRANVRDKYMDKLSQRLQLDAKGNVIGIRKYDGMQLDLLVQCMFLAESGVAVDRAVMEKWPSSTAAALFQAAQELNLFRKPSELNRILAEQLSKWFGEEKLGNASPEEIEKVIEATEKNLFDEESATTED